MNPEWYAHSIPQPSLKTVVMSTIHLVVRALAHVVEDLNYKPSSAWGGFNPSLMSQESPNH